MKRTNLMAALLLALLMAVAVPLASGSPNAGPQAKPERPGERGKPPKHSGTVDIQFLAISDWHAQLEPLSGVGGAAFLSTYFNQDRQENPNSLTLTAGDAYGASPPLAGFFDEEPAVRAMRMMGFDIDTFGNHNFDKGIDHLQRMIDLAAAPEGEEPGKPFRYVSANLANVEENLTGVNRFEMFNVGHVRVAVIGITNEEAPEVVTPGNFGTIEITDGVEAAHRARAVAARAGAEVFVVITHKGVRGFDEDGNPFGELIDFAEAVEGFDLIFGDHTDVQYEGVHNDALVVENRSRGRTYSRTTLTYDRTNKQVLAKENEFVVPTTAGVTPDPAIQAMIDDLRAQLAPILGTVIGTSDVEIPHSDKCGTPNGRSCESLVGNVTTDAMRLTYGVDFAITNSGGLRTSLTCPPDGSGGGFCTAHTPPPWQITRGQVLAVLPFGNVVATLNLDGALLKDFLENGVSMTGAQGRFPQVSGMCFTYDLGQPAGDRVTLAVRQAADGTCTGGPVDLTSASTYSLAINDFMAGGGDGYPAVSHLITTREIMDQVLADWVAANSPLNPSIQDRITCTGPGCPTPLP